MSDLFSLLVEQDVRQRSVIVREGRLPWGMEPHEALKADPVKWIDYLEVWRLDLYSDLKRCDKALEIIPKGTDVLDLEGMGAFRKRREITNMIFMVDLRLGEVRRALTLSDSDVEVIRFLKAAILKHKSLHDEGPSDEVDEALWAALEGVWGFVNG